MAKKQKYKNPALDQIWDDLQAYEEFCRDFGYPFNPEDLYRPRIFAYRQFEKKINGRSPKDQWGADLARMNSPSRRPNRRRARNT